MVSHVTSSESGIIDISKWTPCLSKIITQMYLLSDGVGVYISVVMYPVFTWMQVWGWINKLSNFFHLTWCVWQHCFSVCICLWPFKTLYLQSDMWCRVRVGLRMQVRSCLHVRRWGGCQDWQRTRHILRCGCLGNHSRRQGDTWARVKSSH